MSCEQQVAVTSRSFSRHPILRAELLEKYPRTRFNDAGKRLSGDMLVNFLHGAEKAITALERVDDTILSKLPMLKVIGKYGVGTDMIDLAALRRHGVRFGWTGGVNRRSVSELAVAMMISMLRLVPFAYDEVRAGRWRQYVGRELGHQVVGIVGCGHVGKDLVRLLQPFGCKVLACDLLNFPEFYREYGVEAVTFDQLLQRADIVTLHVPLDQSTKGMIGMEAFARMKKQALLLNLARGGIVDELALKQALVSKEIAGAAFDVFAVEPPEDTELLHLENFLVTPHIGGSSEEAILAMGRAAIKGLDENDIPDFTIEDGVRA